MTIQELLAQIPPECIRIQRVDESCTNAHNRKDGICKLTIETREFNANDLYAISTGQRPRMHGLILWIPTDKLPNP